MKQRHPYRIGVTTHDDDTFGVILQIGGFATESEAKIIIEYLERWCEDDEANLLKGKQQ